MEETKACPCLHLPEDERCHKDCTCVNSYMSPGCLYCCTYGSEEQQLEHARMIKAAVDHWWR